MTFETETMADPAAEPTAGPANGAAAEPFGDALRAEARRLVETTVLPQSLIASRLAISPGRLSSWKTRGRWSRPAGAPAAPQLNGARRGRRIGETIDKAAARRTRMIARLYKAFERQVADVESRLLAAPAATEEKDARTLGTLARTLATLIALERDDGATATEPEPVDREELDADLARRIKRWAEGGEESH